LLILTGDGNYEVVAQTRDGVRLDNLSDQPR